MANGLSETSSDTQSVVSQYESGERGDVINPKTTFCNEYLATNGCEGVQLSQEQQDALVDRITSSGLRLDKRGRMVYTIFTEETHKKLLSAAENPVNLPEGVPQPVTVNDENGILDIRYNFAFGGDTLNPDVGSGLILPEATRITESISRAVYTIPQLENPGSIMIFNSDLNLGTWRLVAINDQLSMSARSNIEMSYGAHMVVSNIEAQGQYTSAGKKTDPETLGSIRLSDNSAIDLPAESAIALNTKIFTKDTTGAVVLTDNQRHKIAYEMPTQAQTTVREALSGIKRKREILQRSQYTIADYQRDYSVAAIVAAAEGNERKKPEIPETIRKIVARGKEYTAKGKLGAGEYGTVYLLQSSTGELAVCKVMNENIPPNEQRQFWSEDERLNALAAVQPRGQRPLTPEVLTTSKEIPGSQKEFIVMSFAEGIDVNEVIQTYQLGIRDAVHLAASTARVFHYLNRIGYTYHDFQPKNLRYRVDTHETTCFDFNLLDYATPETKARDAKLVAQMLARNITGVGEITFEQNMELIKAAAVAEQNPELKKMYEGLAAIIGIISGYNEPDQIAELLDIFMTRIDSNQQQSVNVATVTVPINRELLEKMLPSVEEVQIPKVLLETAETAPMQREIGTLERSIAQNTRLQARQKQQEAPLETAIRQLNLQIEGQNAQINKRMMETQKQADQQRQNRLQMLRGDVQYYTQRVADYQIRFKQHQEEFQRLQNGRLAMIEGNPSMMEYHKITEQWDALPEPEMMQSVVSDIEAMILQASSNTTDEQMAHIRERIMGFGLGPDEYSITDMQNPHQEAENIRQVIERKRKILERQRVDLVSKDKIPFDLAERYREHGGIRSVIRKMKQSRDAILSNEEKLRRTQRELDIVTSQVPQIEEPMDVKPLREAMTATQQQLGQKQRQLAEIQTQIRDLPVEIERQSRRRQELQRDVTQLLQYESMLMGLNTTETPNMSSEALAMFRLEKSTPETEDQDYQYMEILAQASLLQFSGVLGERLATQLRERAQKHDASRQGKWVKASMLAKPQWAFIGRSFAQKYPHLAAAIDKISTEQEK